MWTPETLKHPAKAHLGMIEAIILEYTKEGDIILDPMAGTGSTGIIAMLHNRNVIGIEYEGKFCKTIRANIELNRKPRLLPLGHAEIIQGDARFLSSMFKEGTDSLVFSPPYAESMSIPKPFTGWTEEAKRKWWQTYRTQTGGMSFEKFVEYQTEKVYTYSDDQGNIGNLKSQTYLEAMKLVYSGCWSVLKPKGIMVLVVKNFIRNKKVVPLDQHTIKLCESVGFKFIKRHYRKITRMSFWRRLYKQKYGLEIPYEDILVFIKPNGGI